jgi:phage shock protein C
METTMANSLARSRADKMIGGVCGGLGAYFGIDATIVRLVFVLAVLSGLSPSIYLILWIVMPQEQPAPTQYQAAPPPALQDPTGEWQYDPYTGERIKKQS